jgi:hypothetical protein
LLSKKRKGLKICGVCAVGWPHPSDSGEFAPEGRIIDGRRMAGNRTAEMKRILETGRSTGGRKRIEKAEE